MPVDICASTESGRITCYMRVSRTTSIEEPCAPHLARIGGYGDKKTRDKNERRKNETDRDTYVYPRAIRHKTLACRLRLKQSVQDYRSRPFQHASEADNRQCQ